MSEESSKDFIKALISLVEEDKKSVLLYVAFDLAVVSLTLSEKVLQGPDVRAPIVVAGLCCLLASAGLFFNHYRKIHLSTFLLVDQLLALNVEAARALPREIWKRHKLGYHVGYVIRLVGVAALLFAYAAR